MTQKHLSAKEQAYNNDLSRISKLMYKSPLHILPAYEVTRLTPKELKRLRKELLLRFELNQTTQILLNNQAFDKETLLSNIAELTKNGVFHQQVFKHPVLLDFLENGNIHFFEAENARIFFEENKSPDFLNFLQPYFAARLNQLIYFLVSNSAYPNLKKLEKVLAQRANIPGEFWENAFTKIHQHLLATQDNLQRLHDANQVFEKNIGWVVSTKSFKQVFHFTYLKKLEILPHDLEGQLLELIEILLHIVRDILKTNTTDNIKIDKVLLLDIKDLLHFAFKKMKHKNLMELIKLIDDVLNNPFYNIMELGSLFFRSMK